jgi:putative phosphoesterase
MTSRDLTDGLLTEERSFTVPLTIGVISDTHLYARRGTELPAPVLDLFRRAHVGLLVHLGDANTRAVLEHLSGIAPLLAVVGNNDDTELQFTLPHSLRFTVGPYTFGAIHGHGGRTAREVARKRFAGKVDCALFGHSHKPLIETVDDTVFFNPGSATERRWSEHFGIGLITVTGEKFTPDLILFGNPAHLANIKV